MCRGNAEEIASSLQDLDSMQQISQELQRRIKDGDAALREVGGSFLSGLEQLQELTRVATAISASCQVHTPLYIMKFVLILFSSSFLSLIVILLSSNSVILSSETSIGEQWWVFDQDCTQLIHLLHWQKSSVLSSEMYPKCCENIVWIELKPILLDWRDMQSVSAEMACFSSRISLLKM